MHGDFLNDKSGSKAQNSLWFLDSLLHAQVER